MSASRFLLSTVTGSCNLNSNPYRIDGTDQRKTQEKSRSIRYAVAVMAGIPGKSGPPGNQNAFRHGLAWISQRRVNGVLNSTEQVNPRGNSGRLPRRKGRQLQSAFFWDLGEIAENEN